MWSWILVMGKPKYFHLWLTNIIVILSFDFFEYLYKTAISRRILFWTYLISSIRLYLLTKLSLSTAVTFQQFGNQELHKTKKSNNLLMAHINYTVEIVTKSQNECNVFLIYIEAGTRKERYKRVILVTMPCLKKFALI